MLHTRTTYYYIGTKIDVKFIGKNDKGQMRLSRRAVSLRDSPTSATGAPLNAPNPATNPGTAGADKLKAISAAAQNAYDSG